MDAVNELPFATGAVSVRSHLSECEHEVISYFDQFRQPLLGYVLSLGLSVHDGEEIIQEVFLALFRHLNLGKSRRNLRGWIFTVAHNLALKQRRCNHRSRDARVDDGSEAESQIDPSPNPEEQALHSQRQQRLLAVVRVLPELDRCCLRLRAEGLHYREIAQVLDISLGSVSLSLTRSLARLMRVDEV
jgi:RNA polymerase sigma-70 factor (ECF subfamily)